MIPILIGMFLKAWGVVTLSGEAIIGTSTTESHPIAGIRVNTDGTIDKITGEFSTPTYTQIDAATDWIIPNTSATSVFEFKIEERAEGGTASGAFVSPGGSIKDLGTWYPLTGNLTWYVHHITSNGTHSWDITLYVRYGPNGATLDTGDYDMDAVEITV